MNIRHLGLVFATLLLPCLLWGELYKYSELEIKGYGELAPLVKEFVRKAAEIDTQNQKKADAEGRYEYDEYESIEALKDALRLILSRPNKDNMVAKLLPIVRAELLNYGSYYDAMYDLAVEASSGINQKINVVYRSTYIFVLENIMSELRPTLKTRKDVKKIYVYIYKANLKIPNDVRLDRKLRSMFKSRSPSETAKRILEADDPEYQKKNKKGFWGRLFG